MPITPTRFEVACCAWDCDPERTGRTRPLIVDARSAREAGRKARDAGWAAAGGGEWWCPRHATIAATPPIPAR
jgi:hypothetical protein